MRAPIGIATSWSWLALGEARADEHPPLRRMPVLERRGADVLVGPQRLERALGDRRHVLGDDASRHGHGSAPPARWRRGAAAASGASGAPRGASAAQAELRCSALREVPRHRGPRRSSRRNSEARHWSRDSSAAGYRLPPPCCASSTSGTSPSLAEARGRVRAGLNVLSGETGAGKSIVVDSLALLAGGARLGRADPHRRREPLTVTGVFEPAGDGLARACSRRPASRPTGDELLVRREIAPRAAATASSSTTSRRRCGCSPTSRRYLLRIHGQRDELGLVEPDLQRGVARPQRRRRGRGRCSARVAAAFDAHARLAERLARLDGRRPGAPRAARPAALPGRRDRRRAPRCRRGGRSCAPSATCCATPRRSPAASAARSPLLFEEEGAAVDRVGAAPQRAARGVAGWEPRGRAPGRRSSTRLRIRLAEVAPRRSRAGSTAWRPTRRGSTPSRSGWPLLERLFRKHGGSLGGGPRPAAGDRGRARRARRATRQDRDELAARVAAALADVPRGGARACPRRARRGARRWPSASRPSWPTWGSAKARLAVALERRRRADSPLVLDGEAVEFGRARASTRWSSPFAPNPGEEPRPLARIASGGELSRLYLALQLAARGAGTPSEARADAGLRRGRRRHRRRRGRGARAQAPAAGRAAARSSPSPTCRRWRATPTSTSGSASGSSGGRTLRGGRGAGRRRPGRGGGAHARRQRGHRASRCSHAQELIAGAGGAAGAR